GRNEAGGQGDFSASGGLVGEANIQVCKSCVALKLGGDFAFVGKAQRNLFHRLILETNIIAKCRFLQFSIQNKSSLRCRCGDGTAELNLSVETDAQAGTNAYFPYSHIGQRITDGRTGK